jgi:hypothetical protein
MNHHYPLEPSWTLARLTPEMLSEMNLMLSMKIAATGIAHSRQNANRTTWDIWSDFCAALHFTPLLKTLMTPSPYCKSLRTDTVPVQWLPVGLQSTLEQWRAPFVPWGRRLPHRAARTHASQQTENLTSDLRDNSRPTKSRIHPHHASNQYRSQ